MSNEEIIDKLGYLKVGLKDFSKQEAIDQAIDIVDGIGKMKDDIQEIIQGFESRETDTHTKGVCDGLRMTFDLMEKHLGKFEDW
jgi:hypothetical protein